ncbi:MAG: DUF2207 domain-containing protein [Candidatus Margulisiibacteriota bacterium]
MKKVLLLVLACLILAGAGLAEVIRSFDVQAEIRRDGRLVVSEKIRYDFGELERHGIFRFIPLSRRVGKRYQNLAIKPLSVLRDGQPERFVSETSDARINLKIGRAETTMSGSHNFTITYLVDNALTDYADHDELYWNVTGNEWELPIYAASFAAIPPAGVPITKRTAYTGLAGSREQNYRASRQGSFQTTQELNPNEGLTVVLAFPPNTFSKTVFSESDASGHRPFLETLFGQFIVLLILLSNLLAPLLAYRWYLDNHKSRLGKPFPIFDLPKDTAGNRLSPAEAGTIDLTALDQNDIIATIFDLAIRGFLKIEQVLEKTPGFFGIGGQKEKEFYLQRIQPAKDELLAGHESILMERLFQTGERLKLKDLGTDFYTTFNTMEEKIFQGLVAKKLFKQNPRNQKAILLFSGLFLMSTGLFFLVGLPLLILSWRTTGRTPSGDEADFRIDCLKVFLSRMSRNYAWQADQLALVEKMIPYAIALGYIEKFMAAVKAGMPAYQPGWYSGDIIFYASVNSMMSNMQSSVHTSAPSSSSGFGGGGGSGGGGGGGGGGSW